MKPWYLIFKDAAFVAGSLAGLLAGRPANAQESKPLVEFSFVVRDSQGHDVFELEQRHTNTLVLIAEKSVETKRSTASISWKLGSAFLSALNVNGVRPEFKDFYYGETNDWFYQFPMKSSFIIGEDDYRLTKRLRDDNGNFLPQQGPKVGKNAFAYYEITPLETKVNLTSTTVSTLPRAVQIMYEYVNPQDSTTATEKNRVTPLQIAIMPKQRPLQSLLLHNSTADGTPWPYATGCVDENGNVRTMVLQRSFEDATGTNSVAGAWQNVSTNSITGENPYGSINYVDAEAKGKNAFYRVVGMEEAKKASAAQAAAGR